MRQTIPLINVQVGIFCFSWENSGSRDIPHFVVPYHSGVPLEHIRAWSRVVWLYIEAYDDGMVDYLKDRELKEWNTHREATQRGDAVVEATGGRKTQAEKDAAEKGIQEVEEEEARQGEGGAGEGGRKRCIVMCVCLRVYKPLPLNSVAGCVVRLVRVSVIFGLAFNFFSALPYYRIVLDCQCTIWCVCCSRVFSIQAFCVVYNCTHV